MHILVINCSPVRTGATNGITERVKNCCTQRGNTVESVCIDDYDIHLCRGCRRCHETGECFQKDDVKKLMAAYDRADCIVTVSPSYWADVPGQFKVFIDRCTPWCDTHEPHAALKEGKTGFTIALRTGPGMPECERIVSTVEHFYSHLHIRACGHLCLCRVEQKEDLEYREDEIRSFCEKILEAEAPGPENK